MKCNGKLRLNYFSVNVSVLAVGIRPQISKNRQFHLNAVEYSTEFYDLIKAINVYQKE